ncbi:MULTISPECIES: neutral/alkaline ceramidase [unclassified Rhodococcus (in: high G+C Gram-positive bacteria)]|uniref:neutral/alkaline ceramidase n=1 Tax=unclassified Rhodococcus (in: high G+C Gram-positive bacteria) TaxID=192944 RepID=UPI000301A59B|nr:neutral/alkaline ceramidase [Rhodococcus sp. DK17]
MQIRRRSVLAGAALTPAFTTLGSGTAAANPDPDSEFLIGVGISDATGPVADVGMMGYSSFEQRAEGLHQRTRARAFVFAEPGRQRVVYVCVDVCMIFQSVHDAVLARLAELHGGLYTERNVMLTAVHSHAACGGASHDYAYNLAVLGHNRQVFDAEVCGIVEAITAAHDSLAPGSVSYGRSELTDASVNRSRIAFDRNPSEDRDYYPLGIDTSMRVLRITQGGRDVGAINWFPTHGASLTNTNHLISGDNKGAAAYFWEHDHEGVRYLDDDKPRFVAAFPQTNTGDMSPNLDLRPGHGPTDDEFENTRIIGRRQVAAARTAWESASDILTGGVDSRIMYLDMANQEVGGEFTPDGRTYRTSPACVGAAMSAGSTEDGPAIPIFPEGTTNPLVDALGGMDAPIPQWLQDAQAPKLVLVAVGLLPPDGWVPHVLKIQIIRIGGVYVVGGPAEFTIVSGLRIRRTVADRLGVPLENVIFQGYANSYASYCTTPQEYDAQQYEGGSTLFGRYTLPAYQQGFAALADAMRTGRDVPRGPAPRDLSQFQPYAGPGVDHDEPPAGRVFGDVLTEPAAKVSAGEQVTVEFVTGHPRNDPRRRGTFLEIQRRGGDGWVRHADDGDWSTKYRWTRTGSNRSVARITWDVPAGTPAGRYRVQYFGNSRDAAGAITSFTGTSNEFEVG